MENRKRKFMQKSNCFVENTRKNGMKKWSRTMKNTQDGMQIRKKYVKYLLNLCHFHRKKL